MAAEHPDLLLDLQQRLERFEEELAAAQREIERKNQIIDGLTQRLFGKKSERIDPDQYQLELGEDVLGKSEELPPTHCGGEGAPEEEDDEKRNDRKRRKKSALFPRNLPVIVEKIMIPTEVESDPEAYTEIGEEHHDEINSVKAALYWSRKTRKKFKRKDDRSLPPVMVPAPEPSIPGTMVAPDLMAMILVDKYTDHLPHYRQSDRFLRRFGAELSRQTINKWTHAAGSFLEPIGDAIRLELLDTQVLQIDETPMDYLNPGLGKTDRGYLWYYRAVVSGIVYCDWQLGRGHECMFEMLGLDEETRTLDFSGTIQCDGYSAYRALIDRIKGLRLAACLAHIRRKFFEAKKQAPEVTLPILSLIAKLYRIEHWLRETGAPPDCRLLVRRANARPLVAELKEKILTEREKHLPKSKLGEAIGYALNQWEEFVEYLEDGRLEIDNNLIENAIRPAKLGLKNYLFFGSAEAGKTSALFYTLLGNCKVLGIDPELYLAEVLTRMTLSTTSEQAAELTPAKLAPLIRSRQPKPAGDGPADEALRKSDAA